MDDERRNEDDRSSEDEHSGKEPRPLELEDVGQYQKIETNGVKSSPLGLESTEGYVRRVSATIKYNKARTANWVALFLVVGLVVAPALYIAAAVFGPPDARSPIEKMFSNWFAVVSPLLGAAIGGLFGLSIASRHQDDERFLK